MTNMDDIFRRPSSRLVRNPEPPAAVAAAAPQGEGEGADSSGCCDDWDDRDIGEVSVGSLWRLIAGEDQVVTTLTPLLPSPFYPYSVTDHLISECTNRCALIAQIYRGFVALLLTYAC